MCIRDSSLGVTPFEFRKDFWHQKTRVPGLLCGVVCVFLCLAILVEHRLVTDTDRQTQTDTRPWHIPREHSSRGNNISQAYYWNLQLLCLVGDISIQLTRFPLDEISINWHSITSLLICKGISIILYSIPVATRNPTPPPSLSFWQHAANEYMQTVYSRFIQLCFCNSNYRDSCLI